MSVRKAALFSAVALLGSTPTTAADPTPGVVLAYGCGDLVVLGRVKSFDEQTLPIEGGLLGRSRFSSSVTIKRVLYGREARREVPASGLSHGQMREDRDFLLVLSPQLEGGYVISSGAILDRRNRPALAKRCI